MRSLLFSLCVLLVGCKSEYKLLKPVPADQSCIKKLSPKGINSSWFTASIDVVGKHLSGLLFVKKMDDQSYRVVFTNEIGVEFFDFGFDASGAFKVYDVIPQLDKKAVINTLRKDFELMLGLPFRGTPEVLQQGDEIYYRYNQKKEAAYFITDRDCASLQRMELGSSRKRKVTVMLSGNELEAPDSVSIHHHTFGMDIRLKKLVKE
jgi:hypothetical protein